MALLNDKNNLSDLGSISIAISNLGLSGMFYPLNTNPNGYGNFSGVLSPATAVGANTPGNNLVIEGGAGNGTGRGGSIILSTTPTGVPSSSPNNYIQRMFISSSAVNVPNNTTTPIFTVSLATGKSCGLWVTFAAHADNGTDFQMNVGDFSIAAVNKTGFIFSTAANSTSNPTAVSAGTFTRVVSVTGSSTTGFDVRLLVNSSLTPTSEYIGYMVQVPWTDDPTLTIIPK